MSASLRSFCLLRTRYHLFQPMTTCGRTVTSMTSCCNCGAKKNTTLRKQHLTHNNTASKYRHILARLYSSHHDVKELSMKNGSVRSYVKHLSDKYEEAGQILSSSAGGTQLKMEVEEEAKKSRAELATMSELSQQYEDVRNQYEELQNMMVESGREDPEMKKILEKEINETWESLTELDHQVSIRTYVLC